jgi:hypothetical protein
VRGFLCVAHLHYLCRARDADASIPIPSIAGSMGAYDDLLDGLLFREWRVGR